MGLLYLYLYLYRERMANVHGTLRARPTHRIAGRIKHRLKRKVENAYGSKWVQGNFHDD
jgi:hypothetical protein